MEKVFTKEVKIAIVAVIAIMALFFGMNFLKGLSLFGSNSVYLMTFPDAKGLTKSTAVYADGYKVGTVTAIEYDYSKAGNITVEASLDPNLRIPAGSQAVIESDLMGNMKVSLLLANNPRERINPGGVIIGVNNEDAMAGLAAMMPQVQAMVPKLDSIVTSLNTILADPALLNMLHNVEDMSANLKKSTAELNGMMEGVNRTLPGLMQHASNTMAHTEALTNNLSQIDLNATMAKVNNTLDNVEKLTTTLNSNEGTLGLLMHDNTLYNNLNSVVGNADSLMIDLKTNPKRYVHFSVFGKK
ncbi:MAG: MlaD family protein [Prevotellaceae bacterium]|nr:MlaD family protein [Prevotellaceae bacterium]